MNVFLDRRKLLGASMLIASNPAQAQSFLDWISSQDSVEKIYRILKEHLDLKEEYLGLIPDFIKRLQTPGAHTESPDDFRRYLVEPGQRQELEAYVVEEFLIASNYFAVLNGEEQVLKILPI